MNLSIIYRQFGEIYRFRPLPCGTPSGIREETREEKTTDLSGALDEQMTAGEEPDTTILRNLEVLGYGE